MRSLLGEACKVMDGQKGRRQGYEIQHAPQKPASGASPKAQA